jgi:four helix bundle protein
MQDFRKLEVWQKSHKLTLAIYGATIDFPKQEQYGLTSQMRRASSFIPANIAEGCGRGGTIELKRFLTISLGSASELQYHIILASDLGLLHELIAKKLETDVVEVKRMLTSFIKKLEQSPS